MTIKSDRWITRMAREHDMISPFEPAQVREADGRRLISYGVSSYGYDVRCAPEFTASRWRVRWNISGSRATCW